MKDKKERKVLKEAYNPEGITKTRNYADANYNPEGITKTRDLKEKKPKK